MQRLLILACSRRKRANVPPLPAIERYDGPAFRVLRRYRRFSKDRRLIVYILSAKYGLISGEKRIPSYDQQMTSERADHLRPSVAAAMGAAIMHHQPSEVFICAGKNYIGAVDGLADCAPHVSIARGGQGEKLAAPKAWLQEPYRPL